MDGLIRSVGFRLMVGSTQHAAGANPGTLGFWVQDNGDAPVEWEFTNLVVKVLE